MNDFELLRCYAKDRSESAFAELVKRYIDFVYSAALRQVGGDAHLAQDVAQSVFVDLARPLFHGDQMARRLRREPDMRHAKIIAITANEQHCQRLVEAGFDGYLERPLDRRSIQRILTPLVRLPR